MSEPTAVTPPPIPAALQKVKVAAGSWNKYMRVLWYGAAKTGKSTAAASMPKPILCASGGDEQGIAQYLDPSKGDVCFDITTPDQLTAFITYGTKNMDFFKSLVLDPITPIWNDYMDEMGKVFGNKETGEIKGGAWKNVKGPWAIFMRQLKRAKLDVSMTAWVNDILYENVEDSPGITKLSIVSQEIPKVEKRIPHHVDLIFLTTIVLDSKRRPTPIHEVTFMGGRRPRTINPKDLYVGKKWKFDEREPKSPWEVIIEPLRAAWQDSAGAVDFLGIADPIEAETESGETEQMAADLAVGAMLRIIDAATDFRTYRDQTFPKEVAPFINGLKDPAARARVQAAHEIKKTALAAGGK